MQPRGHYLRNASLLAESPRRLASSQTGILSHLKARDLVAQVTSTNLEEASQTPLTVYAGVDPSAPSLHLGNLLPLITLLHFKARGHQPITLIGGATGSIGDPGGRSTERNLLTSEELAANTLKITSQVRKLLENAEKYMLARNLLSPFSISPPLVVDNLDWFKNVTLLDFLRLVGKHVKVNTMMTKDSVAARLQSQQGISFTEFSYQLLQAHDFYTLHKTRGCRVQIGGSDQWGNIVAGIDLIRRRAREGAKQTADSVPLGEEVFGLTIPLLTTPSGEKFGKSAGNAIWLDRTLTSVTDFYQYFIRLPDKMLPSLLRMFTFMLEDDICEIMCQHELHPHLRVAQRTLAKEVTELVHGVGGLRHAEVVSDVLFGKSRQELKTNDVAIAMGDDPRLVRLQWKDVKGQAIARLMADHGGAPSRAQALKVLKSGGLYMNWERVKDAQRTLSRSDLIDNRMVFLRIGQDNYLILMVDGSG